MKKILLVLLVIFGFGFMSCDSLFYSDYDDDIYSNVRYEITGTATSASLTYSNRSGGTEQITVDVPHTIEYDDFFDNFMYISAQNQDSTGSITVSIYRNGGLMDTATSSGAYVIATASYYH